MDEPHQDFSDQLILLVDDDGTGPEVQAVRQHVKSCVACQHELADLRRTLGTVAQVMRVHPSVERLVQWAEASDKVTLDPIGGHLSVCDECRSYVDMVRDEGSRLVGSAAMHEEPVPPALLAQMAALSSPVVAFRAVSKPVVASPVKRPMWRTWGLLAAAGLAVIVGIDVAPTVMPERPSPPVSQVESTPAAPAGAIGTGALQPAAAAPSVVTSPMVTTKLEKSPQDKQKAGLSSSDVKADSAPASTPEARHTVTLAPPPPRTPVDSVSSPQHRSANEDRKDLQNRPSVAAGGLTAPAAHAAAPPPVPLIARRVVPPVTAPVVSGVTDREFALPQPGQAQAQNPAAAADPRLDENIPEDGRSAHLGQPGNTVEKDVLAQVPPATEPPAGPPAMPERSMGGDSPHEETVVPPPAPPPQPDDSPRDAPKSAQSGEDYGASRGYSGPANASTPAKGAPAGVSLSGRQVTDQDAATGTVTRKKVESSHSLEGRAHAVLAELLPRQLPRVTVVSKDGQAPHLVVTLSGPLNTLQLSHVRQTLVARLHLESGAQIQFVTLPAGF